MIATVEAIFAAIFGDISILQVPIQIRFGHVVWARDVYAVKLWVAAHIFAVANDVFSIRFELPLPLPGKLPGKQTTKIGAKFVAAQTIAVANDVCSIRFEFVGPFTLKAAAKVFFCSI